MSKLEESLGIGETGDLRLPYQITLVDTHGRWFMTRAGARMAMQKFVADVEAELREAVLDEVQKALDKDGEVNQARTVIKKLRGTK